MFEALFDLAVNKDSRKSIVILLSIFFEFLCYASLTSYLYVLLIGNYGIIEITNSIELIDYFLQGKFVIVTIIISIIFLFHFAFTSFFVNHVSKYFSDHTRDSLISIAKLKDIDTENFTKDSAISVITNIQSLQTESTHVLFSSLDLILVIKGKAHFNEKNKIEEILKGINNEKYEFLPTLTFFRVAIVSLIIFSLQISNFFSTSPFTSILIIVFFGFAILVSFIICVFVNYLEINSSELVDAIEGLRKFFKLHSL
ncbi:MAG: hypothetical protein H7239_13085 [Flavobacterium sp.]|nr:hypothetical protein [Flavobacterium sp.]